MSRYKPSIPFTVPMKLLIPTYKYVKGVQKKVLPSLEDGLLIFGSFRTFGGTEKVVNDVYAVEDTATIETWYRPDIQSDCLLCLEDGSKYEVIAPPENVEMRNQYMILKVQRYEEGE